MAYTKKKRVINPNDPSSNDDLIYFHVTAHPLLPFILFGPLLEHK